jgi:hypothetical protein
MSMKNLRIVDVAAEIRAVFPLELSCLVLKVAVQGPVLWPTLIYIHTYILAWKLK